MDSSDLRSWQFVQAVCLTTGLQAKSGVNFLSPAQQLGKLTGCPEQEPLHSPRALLPDAPLLVSAPPQLHRAPFAAPPLDAPALPHAHLPWPTDCCTQQSAVGVCDFLVGKRHWPPYMRSAVTGRESVRMSMGRDNFPTAGSSHRLCNLCSTMSRPPHQRDNFGKTWS